jgi:hypothetical protein
MAGFFAAATPRFFSGGNEEEPPKKNRNASQEYLQNLEGGAVSSLSGVAEPAQKDKNRPANVQIVAGDRPADWAQTDALLPIFGRVMWFIIFDPTKWESSRQKVVMKLDDERVFVSKPLRPCALINFATRTSRWGTVHGGGYGRWCCLFGTAADRPAATKSPPWLRAKTLFAFSMRPRVRLDLSIKCFSP